VQIPLTPLTVHYAWAQSLFTHLDLNRIIRCVINVEKILVDGGKFYATFLENPEGKFNLKEIAGPRADGTVGHGHTHFDEDPYHYDFGTFQWICSGTSLTVQNLGSWKHTRGPGSHMLKFTKRFP
jgi:hypothetical protein